MQVTKIKCPLCGQEISKSNYSKHQRRHENHPETFNESVGKYKLNHDGLVCQFCGRVCKNKNSLCNHERLCKLNPNRQPTTYEKYGRIPITSTRSNRVAWNKGLTKETDERVAKGAQTFRDNVKSGAIVICGHPKSVQSIQKMLITRQKTTRRIRYHYGTYQGVHCDSGWELAFILYCIDHSINVCRCTSSFPYVDKNGKQRQYFPDFIIDGVYYEIKGQRDDTTDNKIKYFPQNMQLVILRESEMRPIISYVKKVYGREFTKMYDRSFPSWMDNT